MKKQMIVFYLFKWIAFIFLTYLMLTEDNSEKQKLIMFLLVGFVAVILIWEGIRDFRIKNKTTN